MHRTTHPQLERWGWLAGPAVVVGALVGACGGEPQAATPPGAAAATPRSEAASASAEEPATATRGEPAPAVGTPAVGSAAAAEASSAPPAPVERSPDAIDPCVWYADTTAPPSEGPGSLSDLDARIAGAQPDRVARVVGRARLTARGCPRVSVGIALLVRATGEDDDAITFPIVGDDPADAPTAGPRGDERRDGPWLAGQIEAGVTDCDDQALPTLVLFRAVHASDGAVAGLAFRSLGEPCTVLGHDLTFGDLDDDRSTEIRLRVRTGDVMDMSAGRARAETLRIVDVASWQVQVELEAAVLEAEEVDGYGGRTREGDVTLRDLDADGDRDLVFTHRDEVRMRNDDDSDEESFRSSEHEAYTYDPRLDRYDRTEALDPE